MRFSRDISSATRWVRKPIDPAAFSTFKGREERCRVDRFSGIIPPEPYPAGLFHCSANVLINFIIAQSIRNCGSLIPDAIEDVPRKQGIRYPEVGFQQLEDAETGAKGGGEQEGRWYRMWNPLWFIAHKEGFPSPVPFRKMEKYE